MALYLGNSEKLKVVLNGDKYFLNLLSEILITNGARLLSLDNYILKDSNGIYLTLKENE